MSTQGHRIVIATPISDAIEVASKKNLCNLNSFGNKLFQITIQVPGHGSQPRIPRMGHPGSKMRKLHHVSLSYSLINGLNNIESF